MFIGSSRINWFLVLRREHTIKVRLVIEFTYPNQKWKHRSVESTSTRIFHQSLHYYFLRRTAPTAHKNLRFVQTVQNESGWATGQITLFNSWFSLVHKYKHIKQHAQIGCESIPASTVLRKSDIFLRIRWRASEELKFKTLPRVLEIGHCASMPSLARLLEDIK